MRTILALALILGISTQSQARELTLGETEFVKEVVKTQLRDPGSAEFSVIETADDTNVCGWVNARNGFGGYAGPMPFLVVAVLTPDNFKPYLVMIGSDDVTRNTIIGHCRMSGISVQ